MYNSNFILFSIFIETDIKRIKIKIIQKNESKIFLIFSRFT